MNLRDQNVLLLCFLFQLFYIRLLLPPWWLQMSRAKKYAAILIFIFIFIFCFLRKKANLLTFQRTESSNTPMDGIFAYTILILLTIFSFMFLPKPNRRRPQNQTLAKLPPGSMGWPYIGETLQLYSQDPNAYFSTKHKRLFNVYYATYTSLMYILYYSILY